ncbi:MAG: hypothetical protein AAFY03_01215 [Pseudomonadota bacterium]
MKKTQLVVLGAALALLAACAPSQFGRTPGLNTASDQRIASLKQELSRKPDSLAALNGLGDVYARRSAWAQASGAYQEALIVNATDRLALVGYATSQAALGNFPSALDHAMRALSARVDASALIAAAVALNGQGQHAEAKVYLDQALEINPRDLDVRNNLALTLALARDPAAYGIQRSVAYAPDSDFRHKRNFFVVAAMVGRESAARSEGAGLGVASADMNALFSIGRQARQSGMRAFGLATKL